MKVISFLLSQIYLINFCFGSYSWSQPYYDSHLSNKFPGSAPNQNKTFLSSYISSIMITQTASVGTYFNSIPVFDSKGTAFCFSDLSIFYPSIQAVNILERQQLWEKDVVSSLSLKTSYSYFSRTFVFDEINDSLYIGIQYHSPSYKMFYSLVSLNAANGAILWSTSPLNLSSVQDPVLHPNGLILVNGLANLTSSSLVAFNASGNISWIFTYNTNSVFSIVCGRGIQGHIYVLGYENSSFSLLAIEPEAGTLLWKKRIVASILRLTFVREDDILVLTNSTATILIEPVNGSIVGAVNDFISLALGNNNSIFGISNENVMKYSSDFTLIWTFKPSFLYYITYSSITFDSDGLLYFTALTYSGTVTIAINDTTGNASWRFSYHTVSSSFRPVVTLLQTNNTYLVISKDIVSYTERIIQLQCCSGNGLCNSNGTCSCNQNYYHYDCSVFCSPAQCREHMHCSEFGCVCDENYYGPSCDIFCNSSLCSLDSHGICSFIGCICSPNYYGEYCSTFCEPSATCNSEGICNEQGECECENEWHNVYLFDGPTCLPITLNVSLILVLAGIFVGTFIFLWIGIIWYSKTRTFHKNRYNISLPATEKTALLIEENTLQKDLSRNRNFLIMRAFWSISWLVFVDITILIIELCLRSQLGLNNTTFYGYLSWMPSVFGLAGSFILFVSPSGHHISNMIFFFLSLIGISISICDIYISGRSFVELAHEEGCEEREFTKWNVLSINCIFFVLPIWSLPVRITAARVSWQLTLSHHYIKELVEPHFPKAELLIKGMARFITMFFLPPTLRRSLANKSMKKHHQVHHIFQTVVEIILIIVAVIFQNYLGLVSMSCGLLGAFLGLFKFHKIDTLLNFLAVCFSFVLLGIESAHFECVSNNLELMFDIFLFTFMADFIRLKSVLHSYIESKEKTYLWLQERELYSDMEISSTLFFILSWKIKALKPVKYNPEH